MGKTRVYELARELDKNSKEILQLLEDSGVRGKNHMSALEDNVVRFIKNRFAEMEGRAPVRQKPQSQKGEEKAEARPDAADDRARAIMKTLASDRPLARNLPDILPQRPRRTKPVDRRPVSRMSSHQSHETGRPAGMGAASNRLSKEVPTNTQQGLRTVQETAIRQSHTEMGGVQQRTQVQWKHEQPGRPASQIAPPAQAGKITAPPGVAARTEATKTISSEASVGIEAKGSIPTETSARVEAKSAAPAEVISGKDTKVVAPSDEHGKADTVAAVKPSPKPDARPGQGIQEKAKAQDTQEKDMVQETQGKPAPSSQVRPQEQAKVVPIERERQGKISAPAVKSETARPISRLRPDLARTRGGAASKEQRKGKKSFGRVGDRVSRVVEERLLRSKAVKENISPQPAKRREKPQREKKIALPESIAVKDLAEKLGIAASDLIKTLMGMGVLVTINQEIDYDAASIVADEYGFEAERLSEKEAREFGIEDLPDPPESLKMRPPVVTIMGHVDHGKTSLLDVIRSTNVTAQEAGGITQHIGAYQVELNDKKITFLDTPGHEAFTEMRARGAQVTDIAILVVAADDGVMPQTVEAINHARAAGVPIIVAINKIDKANAEPDRVKQQLSELGLVPEAWGGDTVMVEVSALKKQGIEDLLEMILLVAEMRELKANPDRPARGTVVESELDKGRGPVATVLVQKGTLRIGDAIVAGEVYGRVRAMLDHMGRPVTEAGPSMPVEVLGLSDVPTPGSIMTVVSDDHMAKELAERRLERRRAEEMQAPHRVSLEDLFEHIKEGEVKELNLVLKADVQGSVEALKQAFGQLGTEEVRVNIIHSGVGGITESDVMLAAASNAIVIGFQVRPDANARKVAEREGIDLRTYSIIYDAIDDIKAAMEGLLEPEQREVFVGRAEVRATFKVPKVGTVAGAYVSEGKITRDANVRVIRDNVVIYDGKIASLKRFKEDVREVLAGFECGIGIENFNDIKENDAIEAYKIEEVRREL